MLFQKMHELPLPRVESNNLRQIVCLNLSNNLPPCKIGLILWNLPVEQINTTAKTNTRLQMVQGFRSMKNPNK